MKQIDGGIQLIWQTSLNLNQFKYIAIIDFQTSSWPLDGKKLSHLSSNLNETSNCNPNGHIFSWLKKPNYHVKGIPFPSLFQTQILFFRISCP